jgi:predicted nucleic acid-binding protein
MNVIDASALVEFTLNPELASRSRHLFDDDVFAPALLIAESLNALKKQITRKRISAPRATFAMRRIQTVPIELLSMHNLTEKVWNLSKTFSTYDACYVALAQHLAVPLITCDTKLATEAKKLVPVLVPE